MPITFVSESNNPLFILEPTPSSATNNQVEEYESDSDESVGGNQAEDFSISKRAMTRVWETSQDLGKV